MVVGLAAVGFGAAIEAVDGADRVAGLVAAGSCYSVVFEPIRNTPSAAEASGCGRTVNVPPAGFSATVFKANWIDSACVTALTVS